jgi:hypothetical protein
MVTACMVHALRCNLTHLLNALISAEARPTRQKRMFGVGRCGPVQSRSNAARIASVSAVSCAVSKNPS